MKTNIRFFLLLAASIGWISAGAQQQAKKNPVQLGDQYFAAGEYYTAAHLYAQYLNPPKNQKQASDFPLNSKGRSTTTSSHNFSRADILYKQAESYRLANYWQEAASSYKECAEKDRDKYIDALYWQAVCARSLGQYAAAKETMAGFLKNADDNNVLRASAKKEIQTLSFIQQELARADSILFTTQKLELPNSTEKGAFAPVHVNGNQYIISSSEADSIKINGVNPYHSRLFYVTLDNGSLGPDSFRDPQPITLSSADNLINQGAAATSTNGKYLYFTQWKKVNGQTVSSIYYSRRKRIAWI